MLQKNRNIKILITSCGSGLAEAIYKCLRHSKFKKRIHITVTDINHNTPLFYLADSFIDIGPLENKSSDELKSIIKQFNIVYCGSEYELKCLSDLKFSNCGEDIKSKIIVSPPNTLNLGKDKFYFSKFIQENFSEQHIPCLYFYKNRKNSNFKIKLENFLLSHKKVICKPRYGMGSRGHFCIKSPKELDLIISFQEDYILQKMLTPSNFKEYTCSVYVDYKKNIHGVFVGERKLRSGHTWELNKIYNNEISKFCINLAKKLNLFGPLNIQLFYNGNIIYPFELNVRYSGTTAIRYVMGFKDVLFPLYEYLEIPIPKIEIHKNTFSKSLRSFSEIFFNRENTKKKYFNLI